MVVCVTVCMCVHTTNIGIHVLIHEASFKRTHTHTHVIVYMSVSLTHKYTKTEAHMQTHTMRHCQGMCLFMCASGVHLSTWVYFCVCVHACAFLTRHVCVCIVCLSHMILMLGYNNVWLVLLLFVCFMSVCVCFCTILLFCAILLTFIIYFILLHTTLFFT